MSDVQRRDEIQGDIVHEYDGIEEADNRLPNWWLATFYGAILFGVGYWFYYHEFDVEPTQSEAYAAAAAEATTAEAAEEPELLALVDDASAIAAGRETFATTCAACHGDRGQGVIGPNLTDDRWLHGGGPVAIYTSIRSGITPDQALIQGSAGMPGWGGQLGEDRVRSVTAFLLSIRDTNEAGGREPEGEVYAPEGAAGEGEGAEAEGAEAEATEDAEPADEAGAEETSDEAAAAVEGSSDEGEAAVAEAEGVTPQPEGAASPTE